jgi:hypothetical protein
MTRPSLLSPRRLLRLAASDALNAGRDPVMMLATTMSLLPALLLHVFRPAIDAGGSQAFSLDAFSRYLVPLAFVLPALLVGWVTGMLLLEDRDDGPLQAIAVTPLGRRGFLLYRAIAAAVLGALLALWATWLLLPGATPWTYVLLALLVGAEAVMIAALLPALARNKVEGLALSKVLNLATIVPLAALFGAPLRYLAALVPSYWIGELTLLPAAEVLPFAWLVAIIVHGVGIVLAVRLFGR